MTQPSYFRSLQRRPHRAVPYGHHPRSHRLNGRASRRCHHLLGVDPGGSPYRIAMILRSTPSPGLQRATPLARMSVLFAFQFLFPLLLLLSLWSRSNSCAYNGSIHALSCVGVCLIFLVFVLALTCIRVLYHQTFHWYYRIAIIHIHINTSKQYNKAAIMVRDYAKLFSTSALSSPASRLANDKNAAGRCSSAQNSKGVSRVME